MERRLSNPASSKLKIFREFLSSTRNLHQKNGSKHLPNYGDSNNDYGIEGGSKRHSRRNSAKKNSVSLFDLVDPLMSSSRPTSVALSSTTNIHSINDSSISNGKSVSMYGLANSDCRGSISNHVLVTKKTSSRNPAVRLFNSIKTKLGIRRRRDRSTNKVVDNSQTTGFGSFFATSPDAFSATCNSSSLQNASSSFSTSRSHEVLSNHQDEQMNFDTTFETPLGSRVIDSSISTAISLPYLNRVNESNNSFLQDLDRGHGNDVNETSAIQLHHDDPKPPIPLKQKDTYKSVENNSQVGTIKLKNSLTKELCDLLHYGWYWGGMSKEEAEEKLRGEPEGSFVVRDSSSDHYLLSLSFNSNEKTLHTRIEYRNGKFCFYTSDTECFSSVAELIEYWITNAEHGVFCYSRSRQRHANSYPVRLSKPISRFTEVKSLAHLSRFVIRQYTRFDLIPQLPLPTSLIEYVGQQRYI